jgi:hypothetical protein
MAKIIFEAAAMGNRKYLPISSRMYAAMDAKITSK